MLKIILLFSCYTVSSVVGLYLVKSSFQGLEAIELRNNLHYLFNVKLISGSALYILSFALWLTILSIMPLSIAYPLAVSLTILGSIAVAFFVLHENINSLAMLGVFLVLIGVFILGKSYYA
ncbi:MAG: hypothetical protein KQH63_20920 [Desulfobulbaceae bacterium]|nr:hypothetical protein [Desulfobulbaceae bacterium]